MIRSRAINDDDLEHIDNRHGCIITTNQSERNKSAKSKYNHDQSECP